MECERIIQHSNDGRKDFIDRNMDVCVHRDSNVK